MAIGISSASAMNPPGLPYGFPLQVIGTAGSGISAGANQPLDFKSSGLQATALPLAPLPQWPPAPPATPAGFPSPPAGENFAPVHPSTALQYAANASAIANTDLNTTQNVLRNAQAALQGSQSRLALLEATRASSSASLALASAMESQTRAVLVANGVAAYLATGTSQSTSTAAAQVATNGSMNERTVVQEEVRLALQTALHHDTVAWQQAQNEMGIQQTRLTRIVKEIPLVKENLNSAASNLAAASAAVSWNQTAATNADRLTALLQITSADTANGIPRIVLSAYKWAASYLATSQPSCGITWPEIASIGKIESNQARFGGARLASNGDVYPPILGPPLNGSSSNAFLLAPQSGLFDGGGSFEQAVGPLQFLPSTWANLAGQLPMGMSRSPNNIFSAAVGAGTYLCHAAGPLPMTSVAGLDAAYSSYNHSAAYVAQAISLAQQYGAQLTVTSAG